MDEGLEPIREFESSRISQAAARLSSLLTDCSSSTATGLGGGFETGGSAALHWYPDTEMLLCPRLRLGMSLSLCVGMLEAVLVVSDVSLVVD